MNSIFRNGCTVQGPNSAWLCFGGIRGSDKISEFLDHPLALQQHAHHGPGGDKGHQVFKEGFSAVHCIEPFGLFPAEAFHAKPHDLEHLLHLVQDLANSAGPYSIGFDHQKGLLFHGSKAYTEPLGKSNFAYGEHRFAGFGLPYHIRLSNEMARGYRAERLGEEIRRTLALLLLERVQDPRLQQLTIYAVRVSPDLRVARVYYRTGLDDRGTRQALDRARGFLRREVARILALRAVPELHFEMLEDLP